MTLLIGSELVEVQEYIKSMACEDGITILECRKCICLQISDYGVFW